MDWKTSKNTSHLSTSLPLWLEQWYISNISNHCWSYWWHRIRFRKLAKKIRDESGNLILDQNGDPVLEKLLCRHRYVLTINTKTKKLYNGSKELIDISSSFTPQKMEFMKAGGSYAVVFGKKLQTFAANTLGVEPKPVFAKSKEVSIEDRGLTAVEKIFNKNAVGTSGNTLHAGSYVRVNVNIVGSQTLPA